VWCSGVVGGGVAPSQSHFPQPFEANSPTTHRRQICRVLLLCMQWLRRVAGGRSLMSGNLRQRIDEIEKRVQRDEGNRGIQEIVLPIGELYAAAKSLIPKKRIAILTGFPCLIDFTPPTETDGPLGAVAIAKTLIASGKEVVILTDECNEEPMLATVSGAGISSPLLLLESFPARNDFDDDDFLRLEALSR
jgi:hypothetical protein